MFVVGKKGFVPTQDIFKLQPAVSEVVNKIETFHSFSTSNKVFDYDDFTMRANLNIQTKNRKKAS